MTASGRDGGTLDSRPFDFPPANRAKSLPAATLCVHGLTGTPYDLRGVGRALAERGIRARAIVLPGHESAPEELARVSYLDWFDAVAEALTELRREHERVFCVGLSLGGLLTLAHAAASHCDAIAVVATPLHMPLMTRLALPLLRYWQPLRPKRQGSDICDPEARACNPGFDVMPLAAVQELIKLQARVVARLPRITVPTLVAHGALDRTADPSDAEVIASSIASRRVERLTLARSGHVVTVDYDGAELSRRIAAFFEELASD